MKRYYPLVALLLGSPAWAAEVFCLRGFAGFAAGESEPAAIVDSTYGALMDALGKDLSPGTLEALVTSGKPFDVPDQLGTDLYALQRRMKDFEDLVRTKGWVFFFVGWRRGPISAIGWHVRRLRL